MKKLIIGLLAVLLLTGCGRKELEPWEMPQVDAAPTVAPTALPSMGNASPEKYIWNEIAGFDMAVPGVAGERITEKLSHSESVKLFGAGFLPPGLFTESQSSYTARSLQKTVHEVLVDAEGELAENAYVEFKYLPKNGNEKRAIVVMAELCSHETLEKLNNGALQLHVSLAEGQRCQASSYYLKDFWLYRLGDARYAQALVLPGSYFSRVSALESGLEDGEELQLPRQVLLSFSCGEDVSDEEFIAAVCRIWQEGRGNAPEPPVETPRLPQPGEKGAA